MWNLRYVLVSPFSSKHSYSAQQCGWKSKHLYLSSRAEIEYLPRQRYIRFWQNIRLYTITKFNGHKSWNLFTFWSAVPSLIGCTSKDKPMEVFRKSFSSVMQPNFVLMVSLINGIVVFGLMNIQFVWCAIFASGIIGPYFFENYARVPVMVTDGRYPAMITNILWPEFNAINFRDVRF